MKKPRLDQLIFERGLTNSRERAKTTIMSGLVFVNGQRMDKPGTPVSPDCKIEIKGDALPYVSRGGLKLEKALKVFDIKPEGMVCIDCGASTGGFTDVLLQNGAARVYAVDVGYGQLAWSIRSDPRVITMERTNVRRLTAESIPEKLDLAVMDLSFISLRLILRPVHGLLRGGGEAVCLIKPQFEAGRDKVGKKGVVHDRQTHLQVLEDFLSYAGDSGFSVLALSHSPIKGPEGNIEYLAYLKKGGEYNESIDLSAVVEDSHIQLKLPRQED